jgi:mono/diheme cytochrome c family protein
LGHPNGWYRMTAQKLIILKNDQSIVDDLKQIALGETGAIEKLFKGNVDFTLRRLHALWTLEGLHKIDHEVLTECLKAEDPRLKIAAIRNSEPFLEKDDAEIKQALIAMQNEAEPEVLQQLILSLRSKQEETKDVVKAIASAHPDNEVIKVTAAENLSPMYSEIESIREKYKLRGGDATVQILNGMKIFQEVCATCHGKDGKGINQLAPPLVGSPRLKGDVHTTIKILLHGLTGPVDGKEYNGPMAPVAEYNDEQIAEIVSYVREHLNGTGTVWRGEVRRVREQYKDRKTYWTIKELQATAQKK